MNARFPTRWLSLVVLLAGLALGTAQADFVLIEDFEDLVAGPIDEQHGWFAAADTSVVTDDPANADNQVLAVTTDSTRVYRAAPILDGTVRVFFLRFRFAALQCYSFGLSDRTSPERFDEFESELSMTNASNELRINDGGTYDPLATLAPDTWYNVWMVVDNITDDTQVYLHARPGQPATADDLLQFDGQTVFEFRNTTAGDLPTFFIKTGGGYGPAGPLYLDDLYLEETDALNLSNPTGSLVGDLDGDGDVDLADLAQLLAHSGTTSGAAYEDGDLDGDGDVDLSDLAALLGVYGTT